MNERDRLIIVFLVVGLVVISAYTLSPKSYYSHKHPILDKVRENFTLLKNEYREIPLREGSEGAYTENKSVITLCLKNPETGEYYDMNTIMYVALHELGHIVSKTHGHNDEFKRNFATLLRRAAAIGIYDPRKIIPASYCGIGPNNE